MKDLSRQKYGKMGIILSCNFLRSIPIISSTGGILGWKKINKMKNSFVLMLLVLFSYGCEKELLEENERTERIENVYSLIKEKEPSITREVFMSKVSSSSTSYTVTDIIDFLSAYGNTVPDILPAFNNYYQDIGLGGSYMGNLSRINGNNFFATGNQVLQDTLPYTFSWSLDGVQQCEVANPKLWDLDNNLSCDGVLIMNLTISNNSLGYSFSRSEWSYLGYNYIADCDCPDCPCQFCVFYDFYPDDYEPYQYQTSFATWDLNEDNSIDVSDLLILIANFG